jgi:hypothetical protein
MMLRPYQREAVDAVYGFLRTRDDNPASHPDRRCKTR